MGILLIRKIESLVWFFVSSVLVIVLIFGFCIGGVYENLYGLLIDFVFFVIFCEGLWGVVFYLEIVLRLKKF